STATLHNNAVPGILVVDLTTGTHLSERQGGEGQDDQGAGKPVMHHVRDFLPAGAFAKAVMLSGLDAPTGGLARTNPQPVLLRLLDHGTLPNRFRSRVRECFVTAAGFGDLASERAYLRLEKLSCVLRDGAVLEVTLKGFVAGEDGKAGLRGRVVSKQGQMIARALVAGVAGGIGDGVAHSFTSLSTSALGNVQNIDPGNIAQYGVASGFATALDRIAQWYLERANEVYPILEVDAGRVVEVILNEGLELGVDLLNNANDTGGTL
ncbi:MAG: TraB/VirB10 family protein, partial [Wenzhouxiangellaceae bacterium]